MVRTVDRLVGVYDADGGVRGELAYVFGKVRGTAHCALCDVTHSPVRRKRAWDAMVAELGVPFELVHRNERTADLRAVTPEVPVVVAEVDGAFLAVLGLDELGQLGGDVDAFRTALVDALTARDLAVARG